MKILWKEWHQQRWLFFSGCLAGISLPALECLLFWTRSHGFKTDMGGAVLSCAGALFAIVLAIATAHHDTKRGTDDFWHSKPVRLSKIFTVKILLAAVLLLLAFLLTISLDFITHYRRDRDMSFFAWQAFCYTYPIAVVLFAFTMLLVVVVRDNAKAALLAIWAGLLIYFLPLLSGSLGWMNIFERFINANQNSSLLQLILWKLALPQKITPGASPAG